MQKMLCTTPVMVAFGQIWVNETRVRQLAEMIGFLTYGRGWSKTPFLSNTYPVFWDRFRLNITPLRSYSAIFIETHAGNDMGFHVNQLYLPIRERSQMQGCRLQRMSHGVSSYCSLQLSAIQRATLFLRPYAAGRS